LRIKTSSFEDYRSETPREHNDRLRMRGFFATNRKVAVAGDDVAIRSGVAGIQCPWERHHFGIEAPFSQLTLHHAVDRGG